MTRHWSRYGALARFALRYARAEPLTRRPTTDLLTSDFAAEPPSPAERALAVRFTHDLEALGPTFVKLGQLLSTRADLLPPAMLDALERLQDDVAPFPFETVAATIASELGRPVAEAFGTFDPVPVAAASLGQVHRATLPDGTAVAVKVLRPRIREIVRDDLAALRRLAGLAQRHSRVAFRMDVVGIVEEFRRVIGRELDYRAEAVQLERLRAQIDPGSHLVVPRPVASHTTSRVLTMQWIDGRKVTELTAHEREVLGGAALAQELFRTYLHHILVNGFFHADPHPGNVLVTLDGRLALLDVGMVSTVPGSLRDRLLRMLVALADGDSEAVADAALDVGERTPLFDETLFRRGMRDVVSRYAATPAATVKAGRLLLMLGRAAAEAGLRMPPEFALFGKTLMNLEHVGMTLDPAFDPNAAVDRYANEIFAEHLRGELTPRAMLATAAELDRLRRIIPARLAALLDMSDDGIPIHVRVAEQRSFIRGMDRIANRITVGLLVAALIIAGTMWVNDRSGFRLFGVPGMVVIGYTLAALGALVLVRNVMTRDDD